MTDDDIMALAQKHSAYADTTPTLRGQAIVDFAKELLEQAAEEERPRWRAVIDALRDLRV